MKDYQKSISASIIVTCTVMVVCLLLGNWEWLNYASYTLHELCYLPVNIGIFLIPLEVIAAIVIFVRSREKRRHILHNLAVVLSLVICVGTFTFFAGRSSTSGVEYNVEKYAVDYNYYINLNGQPIQITEPQYNLVHNGMPYLYSYENWHWLGKDYYKLGSLKLEEEIINMMKEAEQ